MNLILKLSKIITFFFICAILVFITSPLFSQTEEYHFKPTRDKSTDLMLQHLPESIRERLQLPILDIVNPNGIESINYGNIVPIDFFTKITAGDSGLQVTYTWHKWDTLTQDWSIDAYLRALYTYDSNGNQTERSSQRLSGAVWVNMSRDLYTYDPNGNLTEYLIQNGDVGDWVNDWQYLYAYDLNGNITEYSSQSWDGIDWEKHWRYLYTHNFIGKRIEQLLQRWDGTDWKDDGSRGLYAYDSDGNQIELLWQRWDGTDWDDDSRRLYAYDSDGNQIEFLRQNWDGTGWVNNWRGLYAYDRNGNRVEYLLQSWDVTDWMNELLELYTYDPSGNQIEFLKQNWDGINWVNNWRQLSVFDLNRNQVEYVGQIWDGINWVNNWRYLYTYDTIGNLTEQLWQRWNEAVWVSKNITYVDYTNINLTVENEIIPTGYLLEQNYPNPFNPETVIEYALPVQTEVRLVVYDLRGQEVARLIDGVQQAGNHNIKWDASNVASGIYIYRLQAADFVQTRKMVLLK